LHIQALILTRDEAHQLHDCIASLNGCVDAVTVCDTGSRDGTVERAAALGAECLTVPWEESFAAARNAALSRLRADWVLVLDADERFETSHRTRLRARLHQASPAETALPLEIRTYTRDLEALGYVGTAPADIASLGLHGHVSELQPRLLRPQRGLRYEGRSGESLQPATATTPGATAVAIVHHRRELEAEARRAERVTLRVVLSLRQFLDTGAAADAGLLGALLCEHGLWRAGLAYLRTAERAAPANATVHLRTGVAQWRLGLEEGAVRSLRQAWEAESGQPVIAAELARALLRREPTPALAEAGELLEMALEQAPELDLAVQQIALWHRRRREFDEARAYLYTLLDRHPEHAPALRELGVVALLQDRLGEAEHCLRRACQLRPEDAEAWNNLGCLLERRGLWSEARQAFARAARQHPGQASVLRNLCLAHAACGEHEALCRSTAALLAASTDTEETLRSLRERLLEAGWVEALQELESWAVAARWLSEPARIVAADPISPA